MADYLVRVRPYNPKKGAITQRCTFRGKRFEAEKGWYRISGRHLAGQIEKIEDHRGNPVFEVKTVKEVRTSIRKENLDPSAAERVDESEFRAPAEDRVVYMDEAEEDLEPEPEPEPDLSEEPDEDEIGVEPDEDEDLEPEPEKPRSRKKTTRKKASKRTSRRKSQDM